MNDLTTAVLEDRLLFRYPSKRLSTEDLNKMATFRSIHGRWPVKSSEEWKNFDPPLWARKEFNTND